MKHTHLLSVVFGAGLSLGPLIADAEDVRPLTDGPVAVTPTEAERAEKAAFARVTDMIFSAEEQAEHKPVDFSVLRKAMEAYWAEYPNAWRSALTHYMNAFAKAHPERVLAEWASFTNCANTREAQLAAGKVRFTVALLHIIRKVDSSSGGISTIPQIDRTILRASKWRDVTR